MLRVNVNWTAPQGAPYFSTFYFGGTEPAQAIAAAAAVANFLGVMDGNMAAGYTWNVDQEVEFIDPSTGNIIGTAVVPAATGTGGGTGDPLPLTSQVLIRWRTNVFNAGRELRGRTFFPGFVETSSTLGSVTASLLPGLNTAAENFITASVNGGALVVYSPTHRVFAEVETGSAWNQFAVLRSRRD